MGPSDTPPPRAEPPWGEYGVATPPDPCSPEAEKYLAGEEGLTRDRPSSSEPSMRPTWPRASRCRVLPTMEGSLSKSGQCNVSSLDGQHVRLRVTEGKQGGPGDTCAHAPESHHTHTQEASQQRG